LFDAKVILILIEMHQRQSPLLSTAAIDVKLGPWIALEEGYIAFCYRYAQILLN
jgi:hypothetical protein